MECIIKIEPVDDEDQQAQYRDAPPPPTAVKLEQDPAADAEENFSVDAGFDSSFKSELDTKNSNESLATEPRVTSDVVSRMHQSLQCPLCGTTPFYGRAAELWQHVLDHFNIQLFKCADCDARFRHPLELDRHRAKNHPNSSSSTKSEANMSSSKKLLGRTCRVCRLVLGSQFLCRAHILRHHSDILSRSQYNKLAELLLQGHGTDCNNVHQCPHCPYKINQIAKLAQHLLLNHCSFAAKIDAKELQTDDISRPSSSTLTAKKSNSKSLQCNICPTRFSSRHGRLRHIIRHFGIEPYKCFYCDHRSCSSNDLNLHRQSAHSSTPVTHHEKVHLTTRNCAFCEASFKTLKELSAHILIEHRGRISPAQFKYHKQQLMPSACITMHAAAQTPSTSNIHCHICNRYFNQLDLLVQHLLDNHKPISIDIASNKLVDQKSTSIDISNCVNGRAAVPINQYRQSVDPSTTYSCPFCESKSMVIERFCEHLVDEHSDRVSNKKKAPAPSANVDPLNPCCPFCAWTYKCTDSEYRAHVFAHFDVPLFKCVHCGDSWKTVQQFYVHRMNVKKWDRERTAAAQQGPTSNEDEIRNPNTPKVNVLPLGKVPKLTTN